ncbi:MAG TPA: hypothetical protein VGR40_09815, partial [Candidatus Binatus sp.]|nr:hypothetical protein [Candidatus Binatus sp.]
VTLCAVTWLAVVLVAEASEAAASGEDDWPPSGLTHPLVASITTNPATLSAASATRAPRAPL